MLLGFRVTMGFEELHDGIRCVADTDDEICRHDIASEGEGSALWGCLEINDFEYTKLRPSVSLLLNFGSNNLSSTAVDKAD